MAVLIIDDITDPHDIVQLIDFLASMLATGDADALTSEGTCTLTRGAGPSASRVAEMVRMYDDDEYCLDLLHRDTCTCVEDAAATDPRQGIVVEAPRAHGPVPYVPCPGGHVALLECWMCWSDSHRGAEGASG